MAEEHYERPARLMQHTSTDDLATSIGPLLGALAAVALTLIATGVVVVVFVF